MSYEWMPRSLEEDAKREDAAMEAAQRIIPFSALDSVEKAGRLRDMAMTRLVEELAAIENAGAPNRIEALCRVIATFGQRR